MVVTLRQPDGASGVLIIADPGPVIKIDDGQKLARAPWASTWIVYGRSAGKPVEADVVVTLRADAASVPAAVQSLANDLVSAEEIALEDDQTGEPVLGRMLLGAASVASRSPAGVSAGQVGVTFSLHPQVHEAGYILDEAEVVITDEAGVELEYREAI